MGTGPTPTLEAPSTVRPPIHQNQTTNTQLSRIGTLLDASISGVDNLGVP